MDVVPDAGAVVVTGSYARGLATETSDLDIKAFTRTRSGPYFTWFEERREGSPLHVSAGVKGLNQWLAWRSEAAQWALGFPAVYEARFVWAEDWARERLGDPPTHVHPPASVELEDFIEATMKAKRAAIAGDVPGLRLYAHDAGLLAPRLLYPCNPEREVTSRREALEAALTLPLAPMNYPEDLRICLGLVPGDDDAVHTSVGRLATGLLAFLRERKPDVDDQPELARYLADGTLERHVRSLP